MAYKMIAKRNTTWSEEEVKFLIDNYDKYSATEIAHKLRRSISAIYKRANDIGLKKTERITSRQPWTAEDDRYVEDNYPLASLSEMAKHLERTERAICTRASTLGVSRVCSPNVYLNFKRIEKKRKLNSAGKTQYTTEGCIKLASAIVLVSIEDLKKDIRALKRVVDRGFKKGKVKNALLKVLISEAAFFNDNFPLYLETDPKEIVLMCWESCKADRDKYLKENLHLIEDQLGKEFIY